MYNVSFCSLLEQRWANYYPLEDFCADSSYFVYVVFVYSDEVYGCVNCGMACQGLWILTGCTCIILSLKMISKKTKDITHF